MISYRQNTAIAWRQIEKQAVLIDPNSGTVFVLNELGAEIWALLEEPRDRRQVVGVVTECRKALPERVDDDVDQFFAHLLSRGLVVTAS